MHVTWLINSNIVDLCDTEEDRLHTEVAGPGREARPTRLHKQTVTKIKLRALALSILHLNYTLEIALHINNSITNLKTKFRSVIYDITSK